MIDMETKVKTYFPEIRRTIRFYYDNPHEIINANEMRIVIGTFIDEHEVPLIEEFLAEN